MTDGLKLAEKNNLPKVIKDFITLTMVVENEVFLYLLEKRTPR